MAIAGFLLQILRGPVRWPSVSSPVNIILITVFVIFILAAFMFRKKVGFFGWLGSSSAAVPSVSWTLILMVLMGLTAQVPARGWLGNMVTFWPFVLCYIWMASILGLVAINHILRLGKSWKEIPAVLNHLGLFVILVCAALGSADKQTLEMTLVEGGTETDAFREDGTAVETGLSVRLEDFTMETYPSGMPKRFASEVAVRGKSCNDVAAVIEVNKPLSIDGWKIYQYGYDEKAGTEGQTSILQLVWDPWLPSVFAGIAMMIAGALLMMFTGLRKEERI